MLLFVFFLAYALTGFGSERGTPKEAIYLRGEVKLIPEMKVGGGPDEGDSPPLFYRPRDVDIAADGTIYVLDAKACEIVVLDADGELRKRFAREGEGPGELREPTGMALDQLGNVVVYEAGNKRFSWFSHDGDFIEAKRFDRDVVRFTCNREGCFVAQTETEHYGPGSRQTKWALVALDSTLSMIATLDSLSSQRWISAQVGGGIASATQPLYEDMVWCDGSSGHIYVARSMEYEIRVFGHDLIRERTLRRNVPPPSIAKAERERYMERLGGSSVLARNALADQVRWPSHGRYLEALYCDGEDNLLALRGSHDGAAHLDVYRPDGTFLGEVKISGFHRSAVFAGESIFVRVFSEGELPAVIRYRMR